jgi:hypothetical protein
MAKGLPYFQFETSEWENGNIQMCTREEKGLFIDICSMYWSRLGDLPYKLVLQKLCAGDATALRSLCDSNIIVEIEGNLSIKFLDIQLEDRGAVSKKNSKIAKDAWAKRKKDKGFDANALRTQSERKANAIPIEENRIEENRIEENILKKDFSEKIIELGKYVFKDTFSVDRAIINYSTSLNNLKESFLNFLTTTDYHLKEMNERAMTKMKNHFFNWLPLHQPKKVENKYADLLQGEWGVDFHLKPTPNDKEAIQELLNDGWVRTNEGMAKRIKK